MKKFKKLLSVILAVMMVMSVMPVGAADAGATGGAGGTWPVIPEGATLIFAEDFESTDYTVDSEILSTSGAVDINKNGKKAFTFSKGAEGLSAKVVNAASDGFSGKALKLTNTTTTSLDFTVFFDGGNKIDFTSQTVNGEPNPFYGQQLVYEFDAKKAGGKELPFMKLDSSVASTVGGSLTPFQKSVTTNWAIRNGPYENTDGITRPWYVTANLSMSSKASFKVVFDQTGAVDVTRTYRNGTLGFIDKSNANSTGESKYWNGKIIKDFVGECFRGETTVDMSAPSKLTTNLAKKATGDADISVIIDNIVVYAVPSIDFVEITPTQSVNPDDGVQVKFTQPFNAGANTFKVTETATGTDVSNAIKSVEMSADKKTATIKMDFGVLDALTQYKIWIDDEFTSEAGALFYKNPLGITATDEWINLGTFTTCDKLQATASPETGTITGYDKGDDQTVTLTFTSALADNVDIANAFTVTDELENDISGLGVTLSDDRKVVTLDLSALDLGEGVHTIKSVENAIYNNANVKASINYTFGTADFTATAAPVKVDQYIAGTETDNVITVNLGAATTLTNDNIITGFEVVDLKGNPVNGLAATVDVTGKVVTLDIKDIDFEIGKYVIKSTEYLVDKRGRQLKTPLNVSVKSVAELSDATIVIEDDFEVDYEVGKNWLTGAGSTLNVDAADGGKWEISNANGSANNFMGVVDGTTLKDKNGTSLGFDSNVLQVTAGSATSLIFWRRPVGDSIDVAGQDKMLVYEFDVWVDGNAAEKKFMAFNTSAQLGFQRLSSSMLHISTGPYYDATSSNYNDPVKGNWYARTSPTLSTKRSVTVIVDQTKDVDSIRTYVDGEVCSTPYNSVSNAYSNYGKTAYDFYGENYTGAATLNYGDFKGIYTELNKDSGTTFYIDNLKAYMVNTIEFEEIDWGTTSSDAFNPDAGMTLKFSERVRAEELKKNLTIKDASGNTISNAIKSVTLSSDEKSAKVKFDFSKLEKFSEYDLILSFLFRSKDGAYIARDGVVDGGNQLLAHFTTGDKLETTVSPAAVSGYDKGMDKTVTVTLSNPLKASITDIAGLFVVKDGEGNEIDGLEAVISGDRKTITLQLSGLNLGDGMHTLEAVEGALVDESGVAGSVYVTINTLDFIGTATPDSGLIKNYVEGSTQKINVALSVPAAMDAADIANAFTVKDSLGNPVSGLTASIDNTAKNITIDISGLTLGVGQHTIKSTDILVDSRGRTLDFEYKFDIIPFIATYPASVTEYAPGSEQDIEIALTYPLSAASANNIANVFVVKNQYNSNVEGLGVTVSEDKKTITLSLATLDIEGGEYSIKSKTGMIVNAKGEVLDDIAIALSTSAATGEVADTGVATGSGADLVGNFVTSTLLYEDFDSEDYIRDTNWLISDGFVPAGFTLDTVGKGREFVDSEVKIVKDPADPNGDNYVLKNVAGFKNVAGEVIASEANYHKVMRALDDGSTLNVPTDEVASVKLSTKVYIPTGGSAGMPTGNSTPDGNTKNTARIIALTAGNTTPLTQANLRKSNAGIAQYNTYIQATESAAGTAGTVSSSLTTDTWHTIEMIFGYNPKSDGNMFQSYEVYVDGQKITVAGGYYSANYSTVGGMMSMLASATGGTGVTTVYYDDWSITRTNKFATHINVARADVPETQDIALTFTNKLTAESVQLIEEKGLVSVKDEDGNDVDATITFDNSGVNTKVTINPTYGLKYQTQYVVEVAENYVDNRGNVTKIVDELGNTFGGFTYAFDTKKARDTTIDVESGSLSYDADYMREETEFNYTMILSEAAPHDIYAAVATFSEDNELLGIKYEVFNSGEDTKSFNVSSELGTKYIRLYIWDYTDGKIGRLMQIPDEITSR